MEDPPQGPLPCKSLTDEWNIEPVSSPQLWPGWTTKPEFIERPVDESKGSSSRAFLNFFKSMFGCGVLSLPHAFEQSGLWLGVAFYISFAVICTYTMILIIRCKHTLATREFNYQSRRLDGAPLLVTYGDIAHAVLGRWGRYAVDVQLVVLELLFNVGFVIVMASTLHTLLPTWSHELIVAILSVPVAALSCIRWLRQFWSLSLFGLVVYLLGVIGLTLYHGIDNLTSDEGNKHIRSAAWSTLPLFCGTAVYSQEGILMSLPTAASMRNESQATMVIGGGMALICAIFCSFGAFGYAAGFGSCDIVLKCLPENTLLTVVRVCLIVSLITSSPVQVYVISETLERCLRRRHGVAPSLWRVSAMRVILVGITSLIAVAVPDFAVFTAFVGNLFIPVIGFIFPPVLFILIRRLPPSGLVFEQLIEQAGEDTEGTSQISSQQKPTPGARVCVGIGAEDVCCVAVIVFGLATIGVGMQGTIRDMHR